ncbi:MAG: S1 RNA-binding domain-containing protein [Clostridiales bacterium]|nr:S1 RNA-binding domain-containing protein [Clostridiales bacterium]
MQLEVGNILEGKVTGITKFGAFVELEPGTTGMVHISEVSSTFVKDISEHLQQNQVVKVKVLSIGEDGKISLSIKRANEAKNPPPQPRKNTRFDNDRPPQKKEPLSFEEMMSKYKQSSEEKMSDLRRFMDNKRSR